MDMTRDALQYLAGIAEPHTLNVNGETYADKQVYRMDKGLRAKAIHMSTLTSLVTYIKEDVDGLKGLTGPDEGRYLVHIISPTAVSLVSYLDLDRCRETLVEVNASVPDFAFGRYTGHESFLIALQSKFIENEDRQLLLKFAGTIESGSIAEYGDTGVAQKATVKTGIASKGDAIIPNPVSLKPFRTFIEVEQPESSFVFRMRDEACGVECAIFEADGGAWKNWAMNNVKEYLQHELSDIHTVTVIS